MNDQFYQWLVYTTSIFFKKEQEVIKDNYYSNSNECMLQIVA